MFDDNIVMQLCRDDGITFFFSGNKTGTRFFRFENKFHKEIAHAFDVFTKQYYIIVAKNCMIFKCA